MNNVSDRFIISTTAAAVAANSVAPALAIPDNCHTIIIFNPDGANSVWAAIGAAPAALDPTGGAGIIPIVIPPQSSATIGCGPATLRPNATVGGTDTLIYQTSAGNVQVNISYICANQN